MEQCPLDHNDIYEKIGSISATVISMDKKMDEILNNSKEFKEEVNKRFLPLEATKNKLLGIVSVLSVIMSVAGSWLWERITKH